MSEPVEDVFEQIGKIDLESVTKQACVVPDLEMGDGHTAILRLPMAPFCVHDATPEILETFSEFTGQKIIDGDSTPVTVGCQNGEPKYVALEQGGKIFLRPVMKWEGQIRAVAPELYERLLTEQIRLTLSSADLNEDGDNK